MANNDYPSPRNPPADPPPFPFSGLEMCNNMTIKVFDSETGQTHLAKEVLILDDSDDEMDEASHDRAYWLGRELMQAIYGTVRDAKILRRRNPDPNERYGAEWEVTRDVCAVKQIDRRRFQLHGSRLAENPIEEIKAMQYIAQNILPLDARSNPSLFERIMREANVLLPLEALEDDQYYYNIMPFCAGGELFAKLEEFGRLTEPQARYWMKQILNGICTLQNTGICHRDLSLENVLIHNDSCFIMDFGMCCRVPFTNIPPNSTNIFLPRVRGGRQLLHADRTMGKWAYMAPEIALNAEPFDGFAVDLWSVGSMLFTMVAGFHPWERPDRAEERFRYLTGGYLARMLTEWGLGFSDELLDLLQRMLFYFATDRLSIEQILAHPWMQGEVERPEEEPEWLN